jgi:hypothetical protein
MTIETPMCVEKGGCQVEFAITIDTGGWILLIVASIVFGAVAQFVGDTRAVYEWFVDAIAFAFGAIVASEFIVALQTVEPVWGGIAILPALVGGLIVGLVVEVATRAMTGGSYSHRPVSA